MSTTPRRTLTPIRSLAVLGALALAGCATTARGPAPSGTVTGAAIVTLEDDRGHDDARETLTMLRLPLPGLGARNDAVVQWSQLETRTSAGDSSSPVAVAPGLGVALVAAELGVELVSADERARVLDEVQTDQPVRTVSLSPRGSAAALSLDGSTLALLHTDGAALEVTGSFPLALALGAGARPVAAVLSPSGEELAVLDEGRREVTFFSIASPEDGVTGLVRGATFPAGKGLTAARWAGGGLVVLERLWDDGELDGVEVLAASGRVSVFDPHRGRVQRAPLPGLPRTLAVAPSGKRVAVVLDEPGALALLAVEDGAVAVLDVQPLDGAAAGISFDQRGRSLLVAMPDLGALSVWTVRGAMLADTGLLVDTGPGVSAVAVVAE